MGLNEYWGVNYYDYDKREVGKMGVREVKEESRVKSIVKMLFWG